MARAAKRLVICLDNSGYEVSLERRKIYVSLPDAKAENLGQLRVIDESGEDYRYPKNAFVEVALPQPIRRAVLAIRLTIGYGFLRQARVGEQRERLQSGIR